jgi:hypothetical protein
MTFASGRTTLRLTPTSDQSIGRRQGPDPGAATGLQPRRHPGRRPEAPGRPRPRPQDRHRARHLHRATSGLTVRRFRNSHPPDSWCPAHVTRLVSGTCDQVGIDGHPGGLTSGWVSGRRRHAGHQRGHGVVHAAAVVDMANRATDTCPEPLLPRATGRFKEGQQVGVRPPCHPGCSCRNRSGPVAFQTLRGGNRLVRGGVPKTCRHPAPLLPSARYASRRTLPASSGQAGAFMWPVPIPARPRPAGETRSPSRTATRSRVRARGCRWPRRRTG